MSLRRRLEKLLTQRVKQAGYRIERAVDYGPHSLDVFDLLVEQIRAAREDLFVIQVGANDGRSGDPLNRYIAEYHWRGILIEPQPEVFTRLRETYRSSPQLILENVAIGVADTTAAIYTVTDASYLASFDRAKLLKRVGDPSRIVELPIKVVTFRSLAERHGITHVDLLLVDTEGFDFEVIQCYLRDEIPMPRLIRYEHLHLSSADRKACVELLGERGYRCVRDERDTVAYRAISVDPGIGAGGPPRR